jgi:uncharacterized protein (TIGR02001 family)
MKKQLLAMPLVLGACFGAAAHAADATDLGAGFSLTGNAALVSDYRFRGYSQTNMLPAVQGGVDLTHSSGFYLGNWNSSISDKVYTDGVVEMDFYGGWKGDIGHGLGLDVGVLEYVYPGSTSPKGGIYNNTDLYVGLSYDVYSLKFSYSPTDFFSVPNSKNTWYVDASANWDLGSGWGLNAHVGYQKLMGNAKFGADGNTYSGLVDYKLGVTKDLSGWVLGLAVVGTDHQRYIVTPHGAAGRLGVVASVSHTF